VVADGHITIEAPHVTRAVNTGGLTWQTLAGFGRTVGGVTAFPVTAAPLDPGGASPRVDYDLWLPVTGEVTVEVHSAPSLDFQGEEGLQFAVSFDGQPPQRVRLGTSTTLETWERAVGEGVRKVVTRHRLEGGGRHTLKLWFVTPGVVFQRVVIDAGGVRPSYLGPPESPRILAPAAHPPSP
jgi:hypothetical protein